MRSRGTHALIKEGAKLIEGVDDILSELPNWKGERKKGGLSRADISKRLSEDERNLWDALSEEPIHIDQIATKASMTTSHALAMLLSMELKNCVKQLSGMMFVRL
jgi:DNA processing protein